MIETVSNPPEAERFDHPSSIPLPEGQHWLVLNPGHTTELQNAYPDFLTADQLYLVKVVADKYRPSGTLNLTLVTDYLLRQPEQVAREEYLEVLMKVLVQDIASTLNALHRHSDAGVEYPAQRRTYLARRVAAAQILATALEPYLTDSTELRRWHDELQQVIKELADSIAQ